MAQISELPDAVLQWGIFKYFNSLELFRLRIVSKHWKSLIRDIWCNVVKDEMIDQVNSLDLIYERETTSKMLTFKMKYLKSYAVLMQRYKLHMNIQELTQALQNPSPLLKILALLSASLLNSAIYSFTQAEYFLNSQLFPITLEFFTDIVSPPTRSVDELQFLKSQIPVLPASVSCRSTLILHSWLDGATEFCILKLEICELEKKYESVRNKIQHISQTWPQKKKFVERAYKILLLNSVKEEIQLNAEDGVVDKMNMLLGQLLDNLKKESSEDRE